MGPHRKDGREGSLSPSLFLSTKRAIAAVKGGIGWVLPEPKGRRVTFGARPFFLFGEK